MTRIRITAIAGALALSSVAFAQDATTGFDVSANVAFTSDYRFRGVSFSDEDFAVQGGFDVAHSSGLYAGTWASSIDSLGGETELDIYGGYGWDAGALSFDVGFLYYAYPGSDDINYYELYGSVSGEVGVVGLTGGVAYVPDQDNVGSDNTYLYTDASLPLGETGLTASAHIGYETGAFGEDLFGDEKLDWSIGVGASIAGLDVSVAYIDTNIDTGIPGVDNLTDATAVLTIGKSL